MVDRLLTLNAVAPVQLARVALPGMLAAGEGAVVTVAFTRTLVGELTGTGVRALVVCPGIVATEWNDGYGHGVPSAMSPQDVAAAGLAGLRLGETVCVPGLEDQEAALKSLLDSEAALMDGGARKTLATRYRQP
ncbi:hypothetical protein DF268_06400 [Streptomyces sp. V2]|uniref:hypothetical protein n=1 Tax=Streptomyces TaxID=1883 RepID=UPI0006EBDC6B|nr:MULTISPECIES: hypothetical protein [Streptomyces]PWG14498.1 hypothetical protein DF268_06400 [Streptomyces sp. V2]